MAASVSPNSKYLFFHRGNDNSGNIYWVAFKPIQENILKNINKIIMEFRKATRDDIRAIVEMIADDELGKVREDFRTPLPNRYYEAFQNINAADNQELMVDVNEQNQAIATFQMTFISYLTHQGGIRAQIEGVRVHKEYRGIGIGKSIFQWAIERAKKRNAHLLQLTTDKKRLDAIRFYQSLGFKASHEGMKMHF
jgi:GNAT superfamily N-acetyltransferase